MITIKNLTSFLILTVGALTLSDSNAILIDIEQSYELDATMVAVPSTSSGDLLFRACSQCPVQSMRVNNNTQYFLGNSVVTLSEFHANATMQGLLYLFYEPDSQIVTRVRLRTNNPEND